MNMITRKSLIFNILREGEYRLLNGRLYLFYVILSIPILAKFNTVYADTSPDMHRVFKERHKATFTWGGTNFSEIDKEKMGSENSSTITFSLHNAQTGKPIAGFDPIVEGAVINLAEVGKELRVVANFKKDEQIGSVKFGYNKSRNFQLEEAAPYAIGLDYTVVSEDQSVYESWAPVLGNNEVSAVVYAEQRAKGSILGKADINFKVVEEPVIEERSRIAFVLYNTKTGQPVVGFNPIVEGSVIDLAEVGKDIQIATRVEGVKDVGSIKSVYKKNIQLKEFTPFTSLDYRKNYVNWSPKVGENTIAATAYADLEGKGKELSSATLHFKIIDSEASDNLNTIIAYPNPTVNELHISSESSNATFTLVDPAGNVVRSGKISQLQQVVSLDVQNLKNGLYYIKMHTEAGISTKKIFIRK